jgi:hypothetical protein
MLFQGSVCKRIGDIVSAEPGGEIDPRPFQPSHIPEGVNLGLQLFEFLDGPEIERLPLEPLTYVLRDNPLDVSVSPLARISRLAPIATSPGRCGTWVNNALDLLDLGDVVDIDVIPGFLIMAWASFSLYSRFPGRLSSLPVSA